MTVDTRDHRYVERVAQRDAAETARAWRRPIFEAGKPVATALHVGTGAEGAVARTGQHHDADVAIPFDRLPDMNELGFGREVDGIHAVRAVDGHPGDMVADIEGHAHAAAPRRSPERIPEAMSASMSAGV